MRRFQKRRGFRRKKPVQWYATAGGYSPLSGAGILSFTGTAGTYPTTLGGVLIDTSEAAVPVPPAIDRMTLECIRGKMMFQLLIAAGANNKEFAVSWGICLLTTNAAGTLVLPDPSDPRDAGQDWLFLDHKTLTYENVVANTVPMVQGETDVFVRSKRVIREDMKLVWVARAQASVVGDQLNVIPAMRCLISRVA